MLTKHSKFQFHKGTIRTLASLLFSSSFFYFNSIKVRLERGAASAETRPHTFQFHKGTIRTHDTDRTFCIIHHFNSIKVRLELFMEAGVKTIISYFNSIKVRSEQGGG